MEKFKKELTIWIYIKVLYQNYVKLNMFHKGDRTVVHFHSHSGKPVIDPFGKLIKELQVLVADCKADSWLPRFMSWPATPKECIARWFVLFKLWIFWKACSKERCNIYVEASQFFCYYCCSLLKVVSVVLKGSDILCCNADICLVIVISICSNSWSTAKLDNQLAAVTSKFKWNELSESFSLPLPFRGKQCCPVVGCFVTRAGYTMSRHSKSTSKRPSHPSRCRFQITIDLNEVFWAAKNNNENSSGTYEHFVFWTHCFDI